MRKQGMLDQFWAEVIGELWAIERLARQLVNPNPRLAMTIYRMICTYLDESSVLRHPEVKVLYARSAFFIGSLSRDPR